MGKSLVSCFLTHGVVIAYRQSKLYDSSKEKVPLRWRYDMARASWSKTAIVSSSVNGPWLRNRLDRSPPQHSSIIRYIVCTCQDTHTHTHPFNGPFSGTTRVSRYQEGKTNLDFTEARDSELQWHQLGHMQVCISLQTDNHASTKPLKVFYRPDALPAAQPTASMHWRHMPAYNK